MSIQAIAFATLLLGLIAGEGPVELVVGEGVETVEVYLDGALVETLEGPPWITGCDFGRELEPHLLEAVARGAEGEVLGRAEQWVNLARPPAEASVVLEEGGDDAGPVARLSWQSVVGADPISVTVSLDGQPIAVSDPRKIHLPPVDMRQLHFLRAELVFSDLVSSVVEATFGGTHAEGLSTQLTAVPLHARRPGRLEPEDLEDWLRTPEGPLSVAAVEEGPAEVTVVRDLATQPALDQLGRTRVSSSRVTRYFQQRGGTTSIRYLARLRGDHRVRFLFALSQASHRSILFPRSAEFTAEDGGLYWLLSNVRPPAGDPEEQRLADAVAVAGMNAGARNRRRAVVLILDPATPQRGLFTPAAVRRYLERVHVPLFVWSPDREWAARDESGAWGPVRDISSLGKLEGAVGELVRNLERQRIVWVEGLHLPQEIALSEGARGQGVNLVR